MAVSRFDELGIGKNFKYFKQPEIPAQQPKPPASPTEDLSKLGDRAFAGNLQKQSLLAKFTGDTCTPDPVKPENPQNYTDIDTQADELIKKHTESGFFGDSFKPNDLGPELANIARTDPDRASALLDNVLDKINGGDKDEIAQSFVEELSPAELREYAKTERGREMLGTLRNHLDEGITWNDEYATMAKIDTAIKSADFERSCEFKNLSPDVQREILNRLDANQGNITAVDNLIRLARDANFARLPLDAQRSVLSAFDKHKEDIVFTDALIKTFGKPEFQSLSATGQATVIADIEKFANTESYKDADEAEDRPYLISLIGDMSAYSVNNPSITSVRNSLDKVLNENIRLEAMYKPKENGGTTLGKADGNTMYMNRHPDALKYGVKQGIDTFVHEVNHIVNGHTDAGTPERFLDEYASRVVGRQAQGIPLSADVQRERLDQLTKNGGDAYGHLNDLYRNNAEFRAVIDAVYADLNKTPPVLTTPEQLREKLLAAGFNSGYMQTPRNLDNH